MGSCPRLDHTKLAGSKEQSKLGRRLDLPTVSSFAESQLLSIKWSEERGVAFRESCRPKSTCEGHRQGGRKGEEGRIVVTGRKITARRGSGKICRIPANRCHYCEEGGGREMPGMFRAYSGTCPGPVDMDTVFLFSAQERSQQNNTVAE